MEARSRPRPARSRAAQPAAAHRPDARWWRTAVVYQVYARSFADANGDGTGDLAGVRERLPYLRELGVDALWFNPWYPSPLADTGYDVSDYRAIDPSLGTLEQAEALIADARALGIRTIVDIVPNHVSHEHRWFRQALASPPGSPERARFWFRPGRGPDGAEPPNGWQSIFGGPAWTRTRTATGEPGEWYLHLFAPEQPDLNWTHADVWREHEDVLRFWFDRGVAGVRIDSAALLVKDPQLAEEDPACGPGEHPFSDRDELHEIYRRWRTLAEGYDEPRVLVGEVWLPDAERFARYLRPDELHTAFNFDFLGRPWEPEALRASIDGTLAVHVPIDAPATWVLSNHDVTRPVTRYGRADSSFTFETRRAGTPTDLALGTRRARAAALLAMALPGSLYVYQGEELGLPEVEEIPDERRQDPIWARSGGLNPGRDGCRVPLPWAGERPPYGPIWARSGGLNPGRDGCRVPLPWAGERPPYGFGAGDGPTWLDQPDGWGPLTVAAQSADPGSMLALYRAGLRLRRDDPWGGHDRLRWLPSPATVLAFARGGRFACLVNFGPDPYPLPREARVLLASDELEGGALPKDTTAWLCRDDEA
jgi:alpha-glucosidase